MFCICCGQKINDNAQACPYCGMIVSKTLAKRMGVVPQNPAENKPAETDKTPANEQNTTGISYYEEPLYENIRRTGPTTVQEKRNFVRFLLFSIFTLGIYGIVYKYQMTEDVNKICADDGKDTPNYLVTVVLSIFTFGAFGLYWHYQIGKRISEYLSENYNVQVSGGVRLMMLKLLSIPTSFITGHIADYFLIDSVNTLAECYNNGLAKDAR